MQNSSLTGILKNFSKDEIKSFGKFVSSPYFNTSEATVQLFEEMKKYYPSFAKKDFTRENLFHAVYGERDYNDELLRKLISNLIKLSEEFIFINSIKSNKALRCITILDNINQYSGGKPMLEGKLKELEKEIESKKIYNGMLEERADMNRIKYNYFVNRNRYKEASQKLNEYGDNTLCQFMQSFSDIYKLKMQVLSSYKQAGSSTACDIFDRHFDLEGFSSEVM